MRILDVFFYGFFMDRDALTAQGFNPGAPQLASLENYDLRIGARATLVPFKGRTVWGAVMGSPHQEIDALYSAPSVADYRPEPVLAGISGGDMIAALCFNLMKSEKTPANKEYAAQLSALAERMKLPPDYVAALRKLAG